MNKKLETSLYSIGGVIAALVVVVALNAIVSKVAARVDLTEDKLYTLSEGTRTILKGLDTPVKVSLYVQPGDSPESLLLKNYAQRIEDLLGEFKQVAGGNIEIEKYAPTPDSDAEDKANLDGVEGQMDRAGDTIYLGVSFTCVDQKTAIPFLSPERERLLEYDLIRGITSVSRVEKPVIGVMTSLPMFGMAMNPMMMQMGQRGGSPPWIVINELKRDFTVREVPMGAEKIDDDISVLVCVHPKGLSDAAQFAIDQFVLRGGKLVAFVDPFCAADSSSQQGMMGMQGPGGSSLGRLTGAWGLEQDMTKVVADLNFRSRIMRGSQPENAPSVLSIDPRGINADDVVTEQVDNLVLWFASGFTGTPAEGLQQTVLLHSTTDSQLADAFMAQMSGEQLARDFKPSGKEYALAVRLTGKFKSAFPDGNPSKPEESPADAGDDAAKKKDEPKKDDALKESVKETAVVLVGDADVLYDRFAVEVQEVFGQQVIIPRNANLTFAQAVIEQLAGDSNLIKVRSRATVARPFTLIRQLQSQAEERYREEIVALERGLQETQGRLSELQVNKDKSQRFILSPEQKEEIENFRRKEAEASRKLKDVRKSLRQDIENLENRLKWINILAVPLVVALSGIALAVIKRKRTAAK